MEFHASSHTPGGHVVVIATGGTIASTTDEHGARVPRLSGRELVERSKTNHPAEVVDSTSLDSSSMTLADIDELAAHAAHALADPATVGVVITHGTDSMAETALALDLQLDTEAPVVLTGAQLPADHAAADGPKNLRDAIAVAADPASRGRGVLVQFNGRTLPARGVFKRHTQDLDTFANVSATPLPRPTPVGVVSLAEVKVAVVAAWPGSGAEEIDAVLNIHPDGIVVAALGAGNVSGAMGESLTRALRNGVPVVIATQVSLGQVAFDYGGAGGGNTLGRLGALPAGWLRPGQARLALAVALASGEDPARLLGLD